MKLLINCYDEDSSNYYIIDNVHMINVWKTRFFGEDEKPAENEFSPSFINVFNKYKPGSRYIMMDGYYTNGEHFILGFNTSMAVLNDDGKKLKRITANKPHELKD